MYIISRLCRKWNWFYHDCFSKPVDAFSVLVRILKGEMMDHSFIESLSMFNWAYRIPITINRILCFYVSAFRGKVTKHKVKASAKCLFNHIASNVHYAVAYFELPQKRYYSLQHCPCTARPLFCIKTWIFAILWGFHAIAGKERIKLNRCLRMTKQFSFLKQGWNKIY